jgi:hypothetical protein
MSFSENYRNCHMDSIGELITTIEFKVKATKEDLEVFEDGIVPWISLERPDKAISRLIDANKVVLPYSTVALYIDYPLNKPVSFELSASASGFTRKQLIQEINKRYHLIYQQEEQSAALITVPVEKEKGRYTEMKQMGWKNLINIISRILRGNNYILINSALNSKIKSLCQPNPLKYQR